MQADVVALMASESPDALILLTAEGRVLHWSRGAHAIFGYASDEACGHVLADLVAPPDFTAEQLVRIDETVASGSATYESVRRRKDGSLLYVDVSTRLIRAPDGSAQILSAE